MKLGTSVIDIQNNGYLRLLLFWMMFPLKFKCPTFENTAVHVGLLLPNPKSVDEVKVLGSMMITFVD